MTRAPVRESTVRRSTEDGLPTQFQPSPARRHGPYDCDRDECHNRDGITLPSIRLGGTALPRTRTMRRAAIERPLSAWMMESGTMAGCAGDG